MDEETALVLVPMIIGAIMGIYLGFIIGRNHPKKLLLRIAYVEGRIDQAEQKASSGKYE